MTKPKITYEVEWKRRDGTWRRAQGKRDSAAAAQQFARLVFGSWTVRPDVRIVEITSTERVLPNKVRATPQQAAEGFQKMREAAK